MIDFGWLWVVMGVGVVILGAAMAFGASKWQRRHRDSATTEVRDRATRCIYEAEEQKQRSEEPARSPR